MTWKAHSAEYLALQRLMDRIIEIVQAKYPHYTRDEAMQHFIDSYPRKGKKDEAT